MSFLFDKIREPDNLKRIEQFLETLWNKKYRVDAKLTDEKAEALSPKTIAEKEKNVQKKSIESQIEKNPLVRSAKSALNAQIKSIKEKT